MERGVILVDGLEAITVEDNPEWVDWAHKNDVIIARHAGCRDISGNQEESYEIILPKPMRWHEDHIILFCPRAHNRQQGFNIHSFIDIEMEDGIPSIMDREQTSKLMNKILSKRGYNIRIEGICRAIRDEDFRQEASFTTLSHPLLKAV